MNDHFDALETRSPAEREAAQMAALPAQIAHAQRHSAAFADILKGVDAASVNSRAALARLPVTRKSELLERQKASRAQGGDAFGGFCGAGARPGHVARVRQPRSDLRTRRRRTRLLAHGPRVVRGGLSRRRAGAQQLQLPHDARRLHPGVGRPRRGLHRVPGRHRPDRTTARRHVRPASPTPTPARPAFCASCWRRPRKPGIDISSITKASVGGEACPPSLTAWFKEQGVDVYQTYATADLGLVAYETARARAWCSTKA